MSDAEDVKTFGCLVSGAVVAVLTVTTLTMWGCPQYAVYEQGMQGQAKLKEAESSRKIAVQEAEAKRDSAVLLAEAEVARAKGVAEANKIIGEGLRGHEEYLRYLWIMSLEHVASSTNGSTVVYVPTEANLPILEAGRATMPEASR